MAEREGVPSARARDIVDALIAQPLGWVDENGVIHRPSGSHSEHRYEGSCLVCRASDRPEALPLLVDAVLNADALRQAGHLDGRSVSAPLGDEATGG